jgi:hypothetical protein
MNNKMIVAVFDSEKKAYEGAKACSAPRESSGDLQSLWG